MSPDEPFRLGLQYLRVKQPVPAGMSPYTLLGMVPLMRTTVQDHPPALVDDPCPSCRSWRLQDGRHRFGAALMAGRSDLLVRRDPGGEFPG